ncbi:MAG TPA: hypothetical protein VMT83_09265 [Burkholderiaceae bacterium]|nr:hypothetical protein [Burkholderiaceae bacterium]
MRSRGLGWAAALAACVWGLSGCVVAPAGYYNGYYYGGYYYPGYYYGGYSPGYYAGGGEAIAVADVAPPAPYYETVPVAPFVGAVWFGGYWNWYGGHYGWVPGYWGHARPGYVWHPYHWAPHGGGRWAMSGGWARGR